VMFSSMASCKHSALHGACREIDNIDSVDHTLLIFTDISEAF
jgi:hypothetical protein